MSDWFFKSLIFVFSLIALLALFGLVIFSANIELKGLDLWLHLATGQHILQHASIPSLDIFSATIEGQPWVNHEWLFQVIVYSIFSQFNIEGLIVFQVLIVTVTFTLLILLGYNREKLLGNIFVLLLVLMVYQIRFTLRPDLLSLFFFSLYMTILGMHLHRRWSLLAIFVIQILWANIHGFFICGPLLIFIGIISELIKRHIPLPFQWKESGRLDQREFNHLKIAFGVSILACFINPHFIEGALYPVNVLASIGGESKIFFKYIHELQKPVTLETLFSGKHYPYYKWLIVVSFLSFFMNIKKIDIGAIILWVVFLLMSLKASRNVAFFSFVAFFVFLSNYQHFSIEQWVSDKWKRYRIHHIFGVLFSIVLILWISDIVNQKVVRGYFDFDTLSRKSEFGGFSKRNFPYKAVDFLIENNVQGRFYNDFNSGSYLIGRTYPNIKVFIDGRTEVYGTDHYLRSRRIWKGDTQEFDVAADEFNLTGAFLNSVYVPAPVKTIRHLYESNEWKLVYFDFDATVFLRDIPSNKNLIDQYEIDLNDYKTERIDLSDYGVKDVTPYQHFNRASVLYRLKFYDKAKLEIEEALRLTPYYAKGYQLLSKIYLKFDEYDLALENARKAKLLNKSDKVNRYLLAQSFYYLGNIEEANKQLRHLYSSSTKKAEILYLKALVLIEEGKFQQGYDVGLKAINRDGSHVDRIIELGDALCDQSQYALGSDVFAKGVAAGKKVEQIQEKLAACREISKE